MYYRRDAAIASNLHLQSNACVFVENWECFVHIPCAQSEFSTIQKYMPIRAFRGAQWSIPPRVLGSPHVWLDNTCCDSSSTPTSIYTIHIYRYAPACTHRIAYAHSPTIRAVLNYKMFHYMRSWCPISSADTLSRAQAMAFPFDCAVTPQTPRAICVMRAFVRLSRAKKNLYVLSAFSTLNKIVVTLHTAAAILRPRYKAKCYTEKKPRQEVKMYVARSSQHLCPQDAIIKMPWLSTSSARHSSTPQPINVIYFVTTRGRFESSYPRSAPAMRFNHHHCAVW